MINIPKSLPNETVIAGVVAIVPRSQDLDIDCNRYIRNRRARELQPIVPSFLRILPPSEIS